jgi:hypothetical protein
MKFIVDGDILSDRLKTIDRLVQSQVVSFELNKKVLKISGQNNGSSCSLFCPAEITDRDGINTFSINLKVLVSSITKRKKIEFDVDENSIKLSAARWKAELLVQQFEEIVVIADEVKTGKNLKVKPRLLKLLNSVLGKLELKPLMAAQDGVSIGVASTDKGTFVACYDHYQSAYVYDKEVTGDISFSLPSAAFVLMSKEFKNEVYDISVTDRELFAYNDNFELSLSLPQQEGDKLSLDDVFTFYKALKDQEFIKIGVKTQGILDLITNAKAIYEKNSTFTFEAKEDKAKLSLQSSYGKMNTLIMLEEPIKKPLSFTCDFGSFASILDKAPATITLKVAKQFLLFTNKPVIYLLGLHDS